MDVSVFDAKAHLSRLLKDVERGEEITITRHGRPVARLVPVDDASVRERELEDFLADVRALRAQVGEPPTSEEIVAWIREGRERDA